jgi:hypothetical protein
MQFDVGAGRTPEVAAPASTQWLSAQFPCSSWTLVLRRDSDRGPDNEQTRLPVSSCSSAENTVVSDFNISSWDGLNGSTAKDSVI